MDNLNEIKDPIVKAKLEGYQEAVFHADNEILQTKRKIDERRGVIAAADVIAQRLTAEHDVINKKMDDGEISHDEAKIRSDQTSYLVNIVKQVSAENKNDLVLLRGQVVGIEKAVKSIGAKFAAEVAKYERWLRVQEAEENGVDELGRNEKQSSDEPQAENTPEDAENGTSAKEDATDVENPSPIKKKRRKAK